jgi:phosphatidylserine/phosphatidylglycerophosphate/cardiolipin synthase-like enzyme
MRIRARNGDLSVRAIAGTHVVLLGMDLPEAWKDRLLGFAIERIDRTEGERYWLRGTRTFEETQPANIDTGTSVSTREHPIQAFLWGDYSAKPDHDYSYRVVALGGVPKNLSEDAEVSVDVATEAPNLGRHGVWFNRGVAASQAWISKFGYRHPDDIPDRAGYTWLSRGLEEAFLEFVGRATAGDRLRAAVYEFQYDAALAAFAAARDRGVDARIVVDAKGDDSTNPRQSNLAAIERLGIGAIVRRREAQPNDIAHNKFVVHVRAGRPYAVWTGSTNFTRGGVFGHSNVGHIVRDESVAGRYLDYWSQLDKDPDRATLRAWTELSALPAGPLPPPGITTVFSPRRDLAALQWYADLMDRADQGVFFTAAFGVSEKLRAVLEKDKTYLRYGLLERRDAKIEILKRDRDNVFAVGSRIRSDYLGRWARERLTGFNTFVKYIHTKFMLIDPLTSDPLVITGSANFSPASTNENDENMLIIRGSTRVADIYLGEFMRLFNHFQFRERVDADIAGRGPVLAGGTASAAADGQPTMPTGEPTSRWDWHLSPRPDWAWPYYVVDWRRCKERELFR